MQHRQEPGGRHRAGTAGRRGAARTALVVTAGVVAAAALVAVTVLPGAGDEPPSASAERRAMAAETTVAAPADPTTAASPRPRPAMQRGVRVDPLPQVAVETPPPADSGSGRRVVFSQSRQRVWLIDDAEMVVRTYPVSGSVYDNLFPGTFSVYSRSRHAVGIDDSGTMEYFVRFTHGTGGSAIGFHDIPVAGGAEVQSEDQLGTPLSHGCVRQAEDDAVALWDFAPIGTTVVVTG